MKDTLPLVGSAAQAAQDTMMRLAEIGLDVEHLIHNLESVPEGMLPSRALRGMLAAVAMDPKVRAATAWYLAREEGVPCPF